MERNHRREGFGPALRRWLPLGLLALGLLLFFFFRLDRYLSFESLRQHREALRRFVADEQALALLLFTFGYMLVTAFSLPVASLLTLAAGFLFGPLLGTISVVIGATAGATILFLAARTSLGELLRAKAGPFLHKMEQGFRENALSYLLVLRLVPLFPFWLVNLVPAFLGVPLRIFVLATFLGIIPGTAIYALVGGGLGALLDAGERPHLDIIFEPRIFLPLVGLAILALLPVLYKQWKSR